MKTLVALLGHSPGTVTGTFYALQEKFGTVDRIITLTTNDLEREDCERLIRTEIQRWRDEQERIQGSQPNELLLEQHHISASDLEDEDSTDEFQLKIGEILENAASQGGEVNLSISGGRKSMSALAAIAAQFIGADKIRMFHLYVTNKKIEESGEINKLLCDYTSFKERVMHPLPDDYVLVEVPFGPENRVNEFIYRQVQRNPDLLAGLRDEVKIGLWSYHFEVKVAEYIGRGSASVQFRFNRAWHRYYLRDNKHQALQGVPPLDVYAERDINDKLQILVAECKLSLNEQANRGQLLEGLSQLKQNREKIEAFVRSLKAQLGESRSLEFERWLVTNANQVPQAVLGQAEAEGVRVIYAPTPRKWKTNVGWQINQLSLAEAPIEDIR
jgi:CRISPR-associated protein (TIGR02584 family)